MNDLLMSILSSPETIPTIAEKYKPILYAVIKELFSMYKDLVNNDEYYETLASNHKNKYDALIRKGFSPDQAMQIMIADIKSFRDYGAKTSGASVKLN